MERFSIFTVVLVPVVFVLYPYCQVVAAVFSYQYNSYGQSTARQSMIFEISSSLRCAETSLLSALPLAVVCQVSPRSELTLNLVEPPFDATALILLLSSSYKVCCCPFSTSSPREVAGCASGSCPYRMSFRYFSRSCLLSTAPFSSGITASAKTSSSESASFEPSLSEMLSSVSDANSALSAVSCCTSNSVASSELNSETVPSVKSAAVTGVTVIPAARTRLIPRLIKFFFLYITHFLLICRKYSILLQYFISTDKTRFFL